MEEKTSSSPTASRQDGNLPPEAAWRSQVAASFQKRRQRPDAAQRTLDKAVRKLDAPHKIAAPPLPTLRPVDERNAVALSVKLRSTLSPTQLVPDPGKPVPRVAPRKVTFNRTGGLPASPVMARSASPTKERATTPLAPYTVVPPGPEQLYKLERTLAERLPLEMFDDGEGDMTPEEWVELGNAQYGGQGTPAFSPFYSDGKWIWSECLVKSYEPSTQEFTIQFISNTPDLKPLVKRVRRLAVRFADENSKRFEARLEHCRAMREQALAHRRLTDLVSQQPDSIAAPIQQRTLHGILGKLMLNAEDVRVLAATFVHLNG